MKKEYVSVEEKQEQREGIEKELKNILPNLDDKSMTIVYSVALALTQK